MSTQVIARGFGSSLAWPDIQVADRQRQITRQRVLAVALVCVRALV